MANAIVDSYLVYQFLKRLTTPFEKTEAYKHGIIDEKGRVLKKKSELTTQEEKDSWQYFDILTNNMKKILAKVPGGQSQMGLYAASALLFKEHANLIGKTDYEMMLLFEEYFNEQRVDKHEISGHVIIDGHVFTDHSGGEKTKFQFGKYTTKDPDYKKDPEEVGMHRNYRRPSSLSFSTLNDAKKWVKTQPKKSKEEIDHVHQKYADREADFKQTMGEEAPANNIGDGKVAGLGVGDQGEPGGKIAVLFKAPMRRKRKQES